ncbi:hypothetical protein DPSP01_002806 [Paraphaeosphaeria sporulosa]
MPESTIWKCALNNLSEDERRHLNVSLANPSDVAEQALAAVKEKQKLRLAKRWKFSKGHGREVIIHDLLEKSANWIQKFKQVGDIAVQYDTTAASLPWAAVRLVLQVSVNDVEAFRAVAEGIEAASRTISRCSIYEAAYLGSTTAGLKVNRRLLQTELEMLCSAVLRYLAWITAYYDQSTPNRLLGSALNSTGGTGEAFDILLELEIEVERVAQLLHGEVAIRTASKRLFGLLEQPVVQSVENLSQFRAMIERDEQQALGLWLSSTNHREEHRRVRNGVLSGTGEWFRHRDEYRQWDGSTSSGILWIHEIPGCGKTKLLSINVEKFLAANESLSNQITLAHASIRDFLQELPDYSTSRINALAAYECICYLLYGSKAAEISESGHANDNSQSFHSYSILYWPRHYARVENPEMTNALDQLLSAFIAEDEGLNIQFWFDDVQDLLDEQHLLE